jgi:hypothetical protein
LILLFALVAGCGTEAEAPACESFVPSSWDPEQEDEVRFAAEEAAWTAAGEAVVDAAYADCGAPPCVAIVGPGVASAPTALNRGVTHRMTGTLTTDVAVTLKVIIRNDDGTDRTLSEVPLEAGTHTLDTEFYAFALGTDVRVQLNLAGPGLAVLDDLQLTAPRWAPTTEPPAGPVHLGFLIHVEEEGSVFENEAAWSRKASVLAGLSDLLHRHGGGLNIQADTSFIRATMGWDSGWVAERIAEGASFSVHIHDESDPDDVEPAIRDGRAAHREAGVTVTDLNGGFATAPWLTARQAGYASLTAYKDPATQGGLPHVQGQPWLVTDGVGASDPAAFMVHDPEGVLLYLPGHDTREVVHARFPESASQVLGQVLAHARPDAINTWYFVFHVDGFGPGDDDPEAYDVWLEDGFDGDLAAYDAFLTDTVDPLIASGDVVLATPDSMLAAWQAWNEPCETD